MAGTMKMATNTKPKAKSRKQCVVMCHSCGAIGLTTKVECPWCGQIDMVEFMEYRRTDPVERQLLAALMMWARIRTYKGHDIGKRAFTHTWKRSFDVLKFWDKELKNAKKKKVNGFGKGPGWQHWC
jgi:hypothetical protein